MPRYIDAELLIQKINDNRELSRWAKDIRVACVMDTPVADVAEVVRCRDCKNYGESKGEFFCNTLEGMVEPRPNGFCVYGKKREG